MKRNNLFLLISEIMLLIYIIIFKTVIAVKYLNYINIINILFYGLLAVVSYFTLGFPKKNKLVDYTAKQNLIIYFIFYYVITYISGLFFGYSKNGYIALGYKYIIINTISLFIMLSLREIYRYMAISKSNKKHLIIITVLIAVLDIIMEINAFDLNSGTEIFKFVEVSLIPRLGLSFLLSYMVYKFDYKLPILFLTLYEVPKYIIPILPDLGDYINSIIKIIFIFICYYNYSILLEKYERKITIIKTKGRRLRLVLIMIPIIIIVGLNSGLFKYHLLAIGSNSMLPSFARGDAVLIEKIPKNQLDTLKEGDVLAHYFNNSIIVHRIISIEFVNGVYKFHTKGDNNDEPDGWTISEKDVYGKQIYTVKYLGIPSVELSEYLKK